MTSVCQWCRTVAPAGAAFCPTCGRQVATGNFPGTAPQWQQQSQWQQPVWTQPAVRTGRGCATWLVGCAVVAGLCFIALVVFGLIIAANTKPANQPQRHTLQMTWLRTPTAQRSG